MVEKVTEGDTGTFDFTSDTLLGGNFSLTTNGTGAANKASKSFDNLTQDTYDVAETDKTGWDKTSSCSSTESGDASTPGSIDLDPGETVTCTFTNTKKTTPISTSQSFTPQDTVNIGGGGSGTYNGQVDFELYKGTDCSGTPVYYERNVSLPDNGTLKSTNGERRLARTIPTSTPSVLTAQASTTGRSATTTTPMATPTHPAASRSPRSRSTTTTLRHSQPCS